MGAVGINSNPCPEHFRLPGCGQGLFLFTARDFGAFVIGTVH